MKFAKTLEPYPDTMTQAEKRAAFVARGTGFNWSVCYPILATEKSTGLRFEITHLYSNGTMATVNTPDRFCSQRAIADLQIDPGEEKDFAALVEQSK